MKQSGKNMRNGCGQKERTGFQSTCKLRKSGAQGEKGGREREKSVREGKVWGKEGGEGK